MKYKFLILLFLTFFCFSKYSTASDSFVHNYKDVICKSENVCSSPVIDLLMDNDHSFGSLTINGINLTVANFPVSTITLEIFEDEIVCEIRYSLYLTSAEKEFSLDMKYEFQAKNVVGMVMKNKESLEEFKRLKKEGYTVKEIYGIGTFCSRGRLYDASLANICELAFGNKAAVKFSKNEMNGMVNFFKTLDDNKSPQEVCLDIKQKEYSHIKEIYRPGQYVNRWIPYLLPKFTGLTFLDLSSAELTNIDFVKNMRLLKRLFLHGNDIDNNDLKSLLDLENLRDLSLSTIKLSNLDIISKLINLTNLDLRQNKLTSIAGLGNLKKLEYLYLTSNNIENIDELSIITGLIRLDASDTKIDNINVVKNMPKLQNLYIAKTLVSNLAPLEDLKQLTSLDISGTTISDISVLEKLNRFWDLNIANSEVANISPIVKFHEMGYLDISNTKVQDISFLSKFTKLRRLGISGLSVDGALDFSSHSYLSTLNLSNTSIDKLSIDNILEDLYELNISNTKITNFEYLKNLKKLKMFNTTGIPVSVFPPIPLGINLSSYSIAGTQIQDLSFLNNKKFSCLDISNSLIDDTELKKLTGASFKVIDLRNSRITKASSIAKIEGLEIFIISPEQKEEMDFNGRPEGIYPHVMKIDERQDICFGFYNNY